MAFRIVRTRSDGRVYSMKDLEAAMINNQQAASGTGPHVIEGRAVLLIYLEASSPVDVLDGDGVVALTTTVFDGQHIPLIFDDRMTIDGDVLAAVAAVIQ